MTTPTSTEPYKLRRARKGRMLAGVAAGLATASGLDVTVVRICIGASMLTGLGVIGYLLLWIVIPEEQPSRGRYVQPAPESTAKVIRVLLLGGAALVLLQRLGIFWPFENRYGHTTFGFDGVLALILLSLGVGVLVSRHRSDGWPSAAPAEQPAPPPSEPFEPWSAAPATPPTDDDATLILERDTDAEGDDTDTVSFVGPLRDVAQSVHRDVSQALAGARSEATRIKKPGGAALGWARVVGWLALLWWLAGLMGVLALWRFGAIHVTVPLLLFGACWIAFTVVLNSLIRIRKPAVVLASLLALLVPVAVGQLTLGTNGPVGTRTMRPLTGAPVMKYRQAIGELELDFASTHFSKAHVTDISARMGTGHMQITVPNDVAVTVVTRIDAGGYDILGKRTAGGIGQRETLRFAGCEGAPELRLVLRSGAGWMHVGRQNGANEATCPAAA